MITSGEFNTLHQDLIIISIVDEYLMITSLRLLH